MVSNNKCDEEIVSDFCNHFCIICKKRIAVFCGTPLVYIGGCCSGVYDKDNKMFYCRTVKSHYDCYSEYIKKKKSKPKTIQSLKFVRNFLDKEKNKAMI